MSRRPVAPGGLVLVSTGPRTRTAWHRIAASHPGLAVCHQPEWMDSVCEAGAFTDASRLYRTDDGRMLLLPLAKRLGSAGPIALLDSWPPYWEGARDSGGLLAADGLLTGDDVRGVVRDLQSLGALRIRVTPSTHDAAVWARSVPDDLPRSTLRGYVLDLAGGFDAVWSRPASKKARYKAGRAERAGVVVESDATGALLAAFDELYRRSVDTWARGHFLPTPVARRVIDGRHSHHKLEVVARRLGERCRVWIARREGVAVSGIVVLSDGSAATYWKGATDKALVGASGATDLLHRQAIARACVEGRNRYDLGTSGLQSLTDFKLGLGARAVDYDVYRFERLPLTDTQEGLRRTLKRTFRAG